MRHLPSHTAPPTIRRTELLMRSAMFVIPRRQATLLVVGGLALLIYAFVALIVLPPAALWSPDEGAKLLQVENLVLRDGHVSYAIEYTGQGIDPTLQFAQADAFGLLRVRDDHLYFQRLPFFPLLTLPLFAAFGLPGIYLLPAFAGAACGVLALLLVAPSQRRLTMWLLIAFGSPIFIYASIFWEHTIATALALTGAVIAFRGGPLTPSNRNVVHWVGVGVLLALSVYMRLELVLFVGPLLFASWLLAPNGRWGPTVAGTVCGLLLLPYVSLHRALFGQPVADNALYLFYPFLYLKNAGWQALPDLLIGPFADESINPGWLGAVWAWAAIVALVACLVRGPRWLRGIAWAVLALTAVAATAFLFNPTPYRAAHGLLFTTPWALVGLCRSRDIWREADRQVRVLVLTVWLGLIAYVLGIIVFRASSPHGGLEWGMRFALTFYPILALFALWPFPKQHSRSVAPVIIALLCCLGLGFQLRGLATIRHDKKINEALNATLAASSAPYVVSDLPWLTLNAAPIYRQKATFEIPSAQRIGEWADLAAAGGDPRFALVTLDEQLPERIAATLPHRQLSVVAVHHIENLRVFELTSVAR